MPAQPSPARLEAFSDGVMAVIITIMVLEFKVPRGDGMAGFLTILPTLAVYLLSFTFTAIYWVNHHHLIDRLKHIDPLILYSNLGFLFCLSLLPFFTDYLVQKHINSFSAEIYCTSLLVTGIAFGFLSMAIKRHLARAGQIETPAEAALLAAELRKNLLSLAFNLLAIGLAFVHPYLALTVATLVVLIWVVPNFGIHPQPPHSLSP